MSESSSVRGSGWALLSGALAVLAPAVAYVILETTFPSGDVGPDGVQHLAAGVLGAYSLVYAASALLLGAFLGAVAGVVSLLRSESGRVWGVLAIAANTLTFALAAAFLAKVLWGRP